MFKSAVLLALLSVTDARWTGGDLQLWTDYKTTFNKQWSPAEENGFKSCFQKNLELIEQFNAEESDGATYGINEFSHLCHESFKAFYGGLHIPKNRTRRFTQMSLLDMQTAAAKPSVDWRKEGAVTHVKNQGQCGSCWAFSAIGNLEGAHFAQTGKLLDLSEEELVQCSSAEGNMGCSGGIMDKAFEWVVENGGIDTEADYPYTSGAGINGKCNTKKTKKDAAKFSGHVDLPRDEKAIAAYLAKHGPISVAVDAGPKWQMYSSGVKTTCFAGQLDHGVLVVGYGTDAGVPYWIVKNSWGPMWGESGYIRLKRGVNCNGIAESACSITV